MLRKDIRRGRVKQVASQLGHPWHVTGKVVKGWQLGRTIGFPTVNLRCGRALLPGNGVYSALVYLDGSFLPAMANIGRNPTVSSDGPRKLEVHILDYCSDLYGRSLTVFFIDFIRRERKFSGIEELKEQLKKDSETIRASLSQNRLI